VSGDDLSLEPGVSVLQSTRGPIPHTKVWGRRTLVCGEETQVQSAPAGALVNLRVIGGQAGSPPDP